MVRPMCGERNPSALYRRVGCRADRKRGSVAVDNDERWHAGHAEHENWMHAPPTREQAVLTRARLLDQHPEQFDNRIYGVSTARCRGGSQRRSCKRRSNSATDWDLEQRGARSLLLEMPYMGKIQETRSVKATKAIIHAAFPEQDRWLPVAMDRDELRWATACISTNAPPSSCLRQSVRR